MGLTGALLQISSKICPHCNKQYGDNNGKKGHSKKQFMKCLYTANYNLYEAIMKINKLEGNDKFEVKNDTVEFSTDGGESKDE